MPTSMQGSMHQQKMLQVNQANSHKLGISSNTYSKTTSGGNTSKTSSERSMHAPNNKSSSSSAPSYAGQNLPTVTLTAGRTEHNSNTRDIGNSLDSLGNSSGRQVDRLGVPQKEDSGTESGEDLRLIAAGLRDQLQMKSDSNIIDDVTCALSRLENSLKEGTDITIDTEKRKALLALVARLQAGLTSPEKLAEIAAAMSELDGTDGLYGETSSPEADAHRSGRQRFAKRRSRIDRHTVGVSREELADARRYMEDMLIMENISHSTTPEVANNNSPPQWFPIEKNASTGAILMQQAAKQNPFMSENMVSNPVKSRLSPTNTGKRRPVSGDFSVSFGLEPTPNQNTTPPTIDGQTITADKRGSENGSPDSNSKFARFSNKKILMKRANTIDIAKTKKFNSDLDTDSDAEDKAQLIGLKRTIHPTVKKRVHNVVPPFEPKTENDRKFLAFINKQSDKPGLGWTNSRSVSNWSTKFGSLKHSFEVGGNTVTAAKPPQVPGHIHVKSHQSPKQQLPQRDPTYISTNQQIAQRLQQEAERQAEERRRKLEYERLEYERREREKLEHLRQQQQLERMERERLEREYYEREIRERNKRTAEHHNGSSVPKPIPVNEFKHAPQSVFRPIDNGDMQPKPIYKPIPQLPTAPHSWQAPSSATSVRPHHPPSPNNYPHSRPDNSFITSPPPSSKSPVGLPWASKPAVDSTSFKNKANKFEERSRYENYNNGPMLQRHNSLRASNVNVAQNDDYKKRPSLPNTTDPYSVQHEYQPNPLSYMPPPPTNISFTYNNRPNKPTYLSYPCLPTAVSDSDNYRSREDSLTNPQAVPLVLTNANPTYCPPQQTQNQQHLLQDSVQPFDITSPTDSGLTSPSVPTMMQNDYTDDDIDSDNLFEYRAVSKVMAKPQSQTAVTVGRRTGHVSDDEVYGKNSKAAKSLLSTMKNIGNNFASDNKRQARITNRPEAPTSPKVCISPDGRSYQAPIVEPLFPDLTKFEPNRKPLYESQTKQNVVPTSYNQNPSYGQTRKQPMMYKSLENIAKRIPPPSVNHNNSMYTPQQPSPTPYVSETQTAYVVTYPTEDTTDDEDHSRYSFTKKTIPDSLPLKRTRNISETSTASSNTASMTYANNLPSPNTSWTANPIIPDEPVMPAAQHFYEPTLNYNSQQNIATPMTRGEDPQMMSHMSYQYNQTTSPGNYTNTGPTQYAETNYAQYPQEHKVPEQSKLAAAASSKNSNTPIPYAKLPQSSRTTDYENLPKPTTKYEGSGQTQAPSQGQQKQSVPLTKQQVPSQAQSQKPIAPAGQVNQQHAAVSKPTDYRPQIVTQTAQPQQRSGTKKAKQTPAITVAKPQEKPSIKKSLANMRKTVSEDYQDMKTVTTVREQNKSVLKEATATKAIQEQTERITTEARRKSMGSALEYQQTEEHRTTSKESQQSHKQMYKSSAPADTPDIVKSSLPKDENQPILKKFGPPQRHHYMPNAYQNPLGKTSKPAATTPSSPTSVHTKSVEVTTTKSILKTSQQTLSSTKPTIVENPSTPQPDDDYIPRNIVYNNVHAFTSLSRRQDEDRSHVEPVVRPNKLSKSDSWNQIINLQNQHMTTSTQKFPQPPINELRRTKSGHSLAIPKMYEAGIDKTVVTEKQRTVAAYFSGQKSPVQQEQHTIIEQTKRSAINRTKTSEKISASRKSLVGSHVPISPGGLTRSATMPHIANLSFLDESNVEDAFEQLIMGS